MMGLGYPSGDLFRGEIQDKNFDTYRIPCFSWMPRIETVLVENPEGGGEPAITCVGGPANAVYDAIGVRLFELPIPTGFKGHCQLPSKT
jgi:CO/xanthine dehydrogenase Mo-binding subunit